MVYYSISRTGFNLVGRYAGATALPTTCKNCLATTILHHNKGQEPEKQLGNNMNKVQNNKPRSMGYPKP